VIKVCIIGSGFGCTALVYALIKDKRFKVTIIGKEL
jgi:cation diffusion facilitator CzcD-associated flavoprotein CzcO